MPTIKLKKPLIIKAGENISDKLTKLVNAEGIVVRLPFKATGFKSSKEPLSRKLLPDIKWADDSKVVVREHIRDVDKTEKIKKKTIKKYTRAKRGK